jgi:hypothetical protein
VRLEGRDGVVVQYLYDDAASQTVSGVAVVVNDRRTKDKLTLTVRFVDDVGVAVAGLPVLSSVLDHEGRTAAVQADGRVVALFDYSTSGLMNAVTLTPGLTWRLSPPDRSQRVRQSIENTSGQEVARAVASSRIDIDGVGRGASYEAAASEIGVSFALLRYEESPTGALTTARDERRQVALYVVHTDRGDVGFSADGKPRFYDLPLAVLGGEAAPGSDLIHSATWEQQHGMVPDHLVLTAGGGVGLYVEDPAAGSIGSAWLDRGGAVHTTLAK